jgi:hypothetical protein
VDDRFLPYDRDLLLLGSKRNSILDLWEVERYGKDNYGDPEYVSIYGMRPTDWYASGVRVLGRTAVECTRDTLGRAIGRDVAAMASIGQLSTPPLVLDLFVGSGNTLYWIIRHMAGSRGIGFESDALVFSLTRQNVAVLRLPVEIVNADYRVGLTGVSESPDQLLVTFIAPPWGNALERTSGLDLRRTSPPITDIVDFLLERFPHNQLLCVIQIYEGVLPDSMNELKARFDWSTERIYPLNSAGKNHGIVLATKGWTPTFGKTN